MKKLRINDNKANSDASDNQSEYDEDSMHGDVSVHDSFILDGSGYSTIGDVMQQVIAVLSKEMSYDELENTLLENIGTNKAGSVGGIHRGKYKDLNRQYGTPDHHKYYARQYESKDKVEFGLINAWNNEVEKIISFVNADKIHFPNGLIQK